MAVADELLQTLLEEGRLPLTAEPVLQVAQQQRCLIEDRVCLSGFHRTDRNSYTASGYQNTQVMDMRDSAYIRPIPPFKAGNKSLAGFSPPSVPA